MVEVYLSPSVQEWNLGYGDYGTEEQRMNLVTDVVGYELERLGISYIRNAPEMRLQEVVTESNAANPGIHVAIHSNAANGNARGAEVYAHRFGGDSERLARDIYAQLEAITPVEDLGVKEGYSAFNGQGYYELRRTSAPAVLVEVSFHDNPEDARFIIENTVEIGIAIARGIAEYLDVPWTPDSPEDLEALKQLYDNRYFTE